MHRQKSSFFFWETPTIGAKINDLMAILSYSGKAQAKLVMMGDIKILVGSFPLKRKRQEKEHNGN